MRRHDFILSHDKAALVVIDMQERLMSEVVNAKSITQNALKVIEVAKIIGLPLLVTEQNSKVFGPTITEIKNALEKHYEPLEKLCFSSFGIEPFTDKLNTYNKKQLIFVGIETHICVAQTALDAVARGYDVHVVSDAVSARGELDHKIGLEKMHSGGVIPCTTEIAIYDLLERAGTETFRKTLPLLKKKS